MRKWIGILRESSNEVGYRWYEDAYENSDDIWSDLFKGVETHTFTLPAGTKLYHGTASDWKPSEIKGPAWFGSYEMARTYVTNVFAHENPVIHLYETTRPYRLLELGRGSKLDARMLAMMDGGDVIPRDMALAVIEAGFEGWAERRTGGEIMLGDLSGIRHIDTLGTDRLTEHQNPNIITVYHGDTKPDVKLHPKMFFSSDPEFCESYGKHITAYRLNTMNLIDSLDEELIEPHLPLYDPYTDSMVETISDYMDRSSDTWEIVEDIADKLVSYAGAAGIIIYEGGIRNFLVYDTRIVTPIETTELTEGTEGVVVSTMSDGDLYRALDGLDLKRFRYLYLGQGETHLVAMRGDDILGIVSLETNPSQADELWFKQVSVDPDATGAGIASLLIDRAYQYAEEHGQKVVPSSFTKEGQRLKPVFARLMKKYPRAAHDKPFKDGIHESPIAHHELQGSSDGSFRDGTGFSQSDRKLLQSKRGIEKIYRAFARTPHSFEIFFVNSDIADGENEKDNADVDAFARRHRAGVHDSVDDIEGKPGVVRVVLLANLSPIEDKMPINGWTLAHKIGHALQDECYGKRESPWAKRVYEVVASLNLIAELESGTKEDKAAPWFQMHSHLPKLLTMKSARDHKLNNDFEMFAEVVAQYLVTGRVQMRFQMDSSLQRRVDMLNAQLQAMFEALEGHVLLEV